MYREKKAAWGGGYVLQTVKRATTYRSECLPLLMIASRDGTDHTRHYFYGLGFCFVLYYSLMFSSQIESPQYGPIQREAFCIRMQNVHGIFHFTTDVAGISCMRT